VGQINEFWNVTILARTDPLFFCNHERGTAPGHRNNHQGWMLHEPRTNISAFAFSGRAFTIFPMKFALAILVYLLMAAILGVGILLVVSGKPLFLIIALVVYVVAFGRLGCMTH
jgi:hypothetical protein